MGLRTRKSVAAATTEAQLWSVQRATAETALDFAIGFLGCRMGNNRNQPIDATARDRLLSIIRAVSIVESRHGTVGANQPKRDPFQCGNPNDSWWKEFTGPTGTGSRFIRGPGLSNLWAGEVGDASETTSGFPAVAKRSLLANPKDGHKNAGFSPSHSYVWGVIYLIHRINSHAGDQSYSCGALSRERLISGAVTYNGGGVDDYRDRLESALTEFGDPLAGQVFMEPVSQSDLIIDLIAAAKTSGQPLIGMKVKFETSSNRLRSVTLEFASDKQETADS
ncbi:hypothetical protein [Ensifer aridi]|uniref:hypothetical protein n=1 Tax=Ensifer aridi TaxID=1708715 RepID=UPI0011117370|nr:hypothetical protein [Ensifer aridi]